MGYGSYDDDAHRAITTSRASLPTEQVFTSTHLHPTMNPKGVKVRESRDSAAHPESIGIIFALDETGSMGDIPPLLAKEELPNFMKFILKGGYVRDPQVLFMGIGDARNREESPLQVGQFESEAHLMDQWLTRIHLEGDGGGNGGESYELALYFAARHTSMDCFEKRGKKGYLFITGDEPHFGEVLAEDVRERIGGGVRADIPFEKIVQEAAKTFHVFFLVPDRQRRTSRGCERSWRDVLGDNVICMESPRDTCAVAATIIGLTEGVLEDLDAAGDKLKAMGKGKNEINQVIRAVEAYAASIGRGGPVRPAERATKRR